MINTDTFFNTLIQNNITFFSGVPDSLLKNICACISANVDTNNHIIAANEGNAVALGIGYHLATSKLPLIYMQNSGLGNIVNPLLSLADTEVYSIPMLFLIGWRGEPGVHDEPQHKKQGGVTLKMLDVMGIKYQVLGTDTTDEQAQEVIERESKKSLETNEPRAIVVKKGTFSDYHDEKDNELTYELSRNEAIRAIVDNLDNDDIIVSTTGMASRELFDYREQLKQGHKKDFLTVGGMGHANHIAMGVALQKPGRKVICLDGDGACLMHMGSMAINGNLDCQNFIHIVLNNGAHDSVGGQSTVGHSLDFQNIAKACRYDLVLHAETTEEILKNMLKLKNFDGKVFFEIKIRQGHSKNLGRPTSTPKQNKLNFIKFLKSK